MGMGKPTIYWTPQPQDGICNAFRMALKERGFSEGDVRSPIVAFSAGEPFWSDPGHDDAVLRHVLAHREQAVLIVERHEFGWSNYLDSARRAENAWLGVANYGMTTDVSGGTHGHRHLRFGNFVRNLVADQRRLIYLRREYFADYPYPTFVHPCNFAASPLHPLASFAEWQERPFDVMCAWAVTNPFRDELGQALHRAVEKGWFKGEIRSPATRGTEARVHEGDAYRRWHLNGRIFIEADGHGLGGGRSWELISTLAMARKRSHMRVRDDWRHGWSCLEFGTPDAARPDEMVDVIVNALRRPGDLYEIYRAGHENAARHTIAGQGEYLETLMQRHGWL